MYIYIYMYIYIHGLYVVLPPRDCPRQAIITTLITTGNDTGGANISILIRMMKDTTINNQHTHAESYRTKSFFDTVIINPKPYKP